MKLIRPARVDSLMLPEVALQRVRALVPAQAGLHIDADDLGDVIAWLRRDLIHLDADALNDRLHAWTQREVTPVLRGGSAFVSFRHARPSTHEEATLDLQERWLDLEPTFRLQARYPTPSEADLATYARLIPQFLELVDAAGRPVGWRRVDEGNAE